MSSVLRDLQSPGARLSRFDPTLRRQLHAWKLDRGGEPELTPGLLSFAITTWTRANGVISLEIEGGFAQMGASTRRGSTVPPARALSASAVRSACSA